MIIDTINAIYEDTFDNLMLVSGTKDSYECACGEPSVRNVKVLQYIPGKSYEYSYTCHCNNSIKIFVKNIRFRDVKE